jgi:hypothetical protein
MSQPMHVTVSNGVPVEYHDTVKHLVELTAELARAPLEHTEIHVKAGGRKYGQITGMAYYNFDGKPFDQQANAHRSRIRAQPDACELITVKLNRGFAEYYRRWSSRTLHYGRLKTAPYTVVHTWDEEFVYILAHEMHHVVQYHRPRLWNSRASASELECEAEACIALALYRLVLSAEATTGHAARR